jgi:hypothetical protein
MDFPKRIKQHTAQSDSFAILLYQLRKAGIFRNVTEHDYGIDFEIEIVHRDRVICRYVKAQVKVLKRLNQISMAFRKSAGLNNPLYYTGQNYLTVPMLFFSQLISNLKD